MAKIENDMLFQLLSSGGSSSGSSTGSSGGSGKAAYGYIGETTLQMEQKGYPLAKEGWNRVVFNWDVVPDIPKGTIYAETNYLYMSSSESGNNDMGYLRINFTNTDTDLSHGYIAYDPGQSPAKTAIPLSARLTSDGIEIVMYVYNPVSAVNLVYLRPSTSGSKSDLNMFFYGIQ